MTSITFYGGVGEIGGNCFLLQDGDTRLFLDFGKNYGQEKKFFDPPYLSPRKIEHYARLNLLPPLPGLYATDDETVEKEPIDGVLLSHPHTDHFDNVRMLRDDYPIYSGEDTDAMIFARETSKQSVGAIGVIAKLTKTNGFETPKTFTHLVPGSHNQIGNLGVEPWPVDHSVHGAYGSIITTTEGTIVYTGDFRTHGPRAALTETFIEKARDAEPDLLLIEGTHVNESKIESEDDVKAKVDSIVKRTPHLVMAEYSLVDLDRLATFLEVAKNNGRDLVLSMKQAYLLQTLAKKNVPSPVSLNDPSIFIYQREKLKGMEFENRVCTACGSQVLSMDQVIQRQDSLIMSTSFYDMNDVAAISPSAGSVYILSSSEPFDEEAEINFEKLQNWLNFLGLPLIQAHASGHATPFELKRAIETIRPKKVVPIHTARPDLYKSFISDLGIHVELPVVGGTMPL